MNVSSKTANALVSASAVWLGIYGLVLRPSKGGTDKYRYLGAVALVYVFMALLADISPEVAGPFAVLLAVAVAVQYSRERRGTTASSGTVKQAATGASGAAAQTFQALPHF